MEEDKLVLNEDTLYGILAINNAIQNRNARLSLNGKGIICVALDSTCTFDGYEENDIKLTKTQLNDLLNQAVQNEGKRLMKLLGMEEPVFMASDEMIERLGGTIPED